MVRRTIGVGAFLILALILIFGFRGCLDARKERAMENYVRDSTELITVSQGEGRTLFEVLSAPSDPDQAVNRENQANALRNESATVVDRARGLDVPDELGEAHADLIEALELRRDGLAVVADELPSALAQEERRASTGRIAQMMQVFLASDVLLTARFRPRMIEALEAEEINADPPREDALRFVRDVDWVNPDFVADEIAGIRGGDGTAAPGLHGNGLGTVSLAGVALTPGAGATVPLSSDAAFGIQVVNQGESTETDVRVVVTVGQGGDASELEETIDEIAAGEAKNVTVPLSGQPPTGQNVPINVLVEPVPGEDVTDNNEADFTVIFTR